LHDHRRLGCVPDMYHKIAAMRFSAHAGCQSVKVLSLVLCVNVLTAIFQMDLGTRMSPFWILLELRVMEVVVTTGAIRVQSSGQKVTVNKPTASFYRPDALPVAQPTVSKQ